MSQQNSPPGLSPALIVLIAIATGLAVASNYYAQPLLETIAQNFGLSVNQAGFIVTAAQMGYAVGLLLLVPLGDMFERRGLIVFMTLLAAGGMLITASSTTLPMMILGTALTGLFSVVAQILVPLAATLAHPEKRGKTVGIIMSGLLLGILLARTVAGALASFGGWRTIYWVASVLMILMALILWRALPRYKQHSGLNYPQLLKSIFTLFCGSHAAANPCSARCAVLCQLQRALDLNGLPVGGPAFWLFRRGHRPVRAGGGRRSVGRLPCRAFGGSGQGGINHYGRPGTAAAVVDTYRFR
jgi:predicted MFS family arabinose efflux permease